MKDHNMTGCPKDYKGSDMCFSLQSLEEGIERLRRTSEEDLFIMVDRTKEDVVRDLLGIHGTLSERHGLLVRIYLHKEA